MRDTLFFIISMIIIIVGLCYMIVELNHDRAVHYGYTVKKTNPFKCEALVKNEWVECNTIYSRKE